MRALELAGELLGAGIDTGKLAKAKEAADRKLERIIKMFGDAGGLRREDWYLADLIAEAYRAAEFSRATMELAELCRYADMMAKKE